eukprot:GILJ01010908.1.p1 GENE.GILJ01010908.1~~GILJ01010908.1.p1  ORF type:complete len:328 (+),score=32.38 GILJ01010908.1:34-984(+)
MADVALADLVASLEELIQKDEGSRGIKPLIIAGELLKAAQDIVTAEVVLILTGFPCRIDSSPPTETDGLHGAVAIARAVKSLGHEAIIVIDECNAEPMRATIQASETPDIPLEIFPAGAVWTDVEHNRVATLLRRAQHVVAIERAGPGSDGHYYTMRGKDMTHLVAPIDRLMPDVTISPCSVRSTGIGDGGNETGTGRVVDLVRKHIPNGEKIACVVAAHNTIMCSVSNWGGYALACAIAAVAMGRGIAPKTMESLNRFCSSAAEQVAITDAMVAAGARDGPTGAASAMVDGMPLSTSIDILENLHQIVKRRSLLS